MKYIVVNLNLIVIVVVSSYRIHTCIVSYVHVFKAYMKTVKRLAVWGVTIYRRTGPHRAIPEYQTHTGRFGSCFLCAEVLNTNFSSRVAAFALNPLVLRLQVNKQETLGLFTFWLRPWLSLLAEPKTTLSRR